MAAAHSAAACRYSMFWPCLLRERQSGNSSVSFVYPSQFLSLSLLVILTASFVQQSAGNKANSQSISTCESNASPVVLRITSTTHAVKFKCGTDLQLRANPAGSNKLWGNAACTKEVDASSVTFTPSPSTAKVVGNKGTEYSLALKNSILPLSPFTVYFSCDPPSTTGAGETGKAKVPVSATTCIVQVSVFSQTAVTVPETNKCTTGQVTVAVTSKSKSVTFGCSEGATLKPALLEHVFIEKAIEKNGDASTGREEEVVLQDLVPNSSLVENAANTGNDTVGYTLSCPDLPSSPQNFFYKCVSPTSGRGAVGTPTECKVLINVEEKPEAETPATPEPSRGEQGVVLGSAFMIAFISCFALVTGNMF
ncbi:SAG-related sequence SRS49D [Toxoplasma gondii RUB]|uniref:SAG-related sequence SRS49D n=1 Tax=Toxoplasma gondii RUB TaxID=935652 RepID=A0A086LKM5_TOXGO|nr:SAG-related sequence SRS49D [Toxoplasma gondii RUB]